MVGVAGEVVVVITNPPQQPRCGEIVSPGGKKMSIIIGHNNRQTTLFVCLPKNSCNPLILQVLRETSTFFMNYSGKLGGPNYDKFFGQNY